MESDTEGQTSASSQNEVVKSIHLSEDDLDTICYLLLTRAAEDLIGLPTSLSLHQKVFDLREALYP